MNEERICRVLIVDNELEYAAQTASKLKEIRPSLLNHNQLQIELTNNAYFVAERLGVSPVGQPPWDIIISDVFMPFPNRSLTETEPDTELQPGEFSYEEKVWVCWQSNYNESALADEKVDHGGLRIAHTIARRLDAGESMSELKLILMSECLFGEERERLLAYQATKSGWLKYYDKTHWETNLSAWPSDQLEPDIFQWAMILSIAQREWKYWGDSIYKRIPGGDIVIGAKTTPQMERTITEARRLGADSTIKTVLITGERGTGREVLAELIHQVRMESLGVEGEFIDIDCSAVPDREFEAQLFDRAEEADGGTLFIDEVDKLAPYHQGRLYHLLRNKKIRGGDRIQTLAFNAHLTICTASKSNLEELNRNGLFHDDLYFLLKDEQLHIKPLRERPADAVSLAEVLSRNGDGRVRLSQDARNWIETYSWPGNTRELINVLTVAVRRELGNVLSADDLKRIVGASPTIPVPIPVAEATVEENDDVVLEFKAEPPFQLLWDEHALLDAKKRKILIAYDLHSVLKGLLEKEPGRHGLIKSQLTFAEIARLYKGNFENAEDAQEIAHKFAQNLRRALDKYGMGHDWLVKTRKSYGYRLGKRWDDPPFIHGSEASLVFTNEIEKVERQRYDNQTGRKKLMSPEY